MYFQRKAFHDEICTEEVAQFELIKCINYLYSNETNCDEPIFIENIELEASDVCRPFWI